jgi:serine/threonine protein kinase
VQFIHKERIVHSGRVVAGIYVRKFYSDFAMVDLKPANFVFVRGQLKLIDFGISKAISNDTTSIYRENQVGTINYMAPEAIIPMDYPEGEGSKAKMKLGRASDVWALGVILYQLIYCELPFGKLSTIQKLHAIPNPLHVIDFPPHNDVAAVESIRVCLVRDPLKRACIEGEFGLLNMRFLGM